MIFFNGPLNDTSYGIVSHNILTQLRNLTDVAVFPIGKMHSSDFLQSVEMQKTMELQSLDFPTLKIWHQFAMNESATCGPQVGYTFFEMNRLTQWEMACLNCLDQLVLPTNWAAEVCRKSGYQKDIEVVPPGYDPEIFKPVDYFPQKCIFLSIGKWEVRKQQDQIVEAFHKAFGNKQDVSLWMSFENKFIGKEFNANKARQYKDLLGSNLVILDRVSEHEQIARIMQQAYCYVAPSLAEGFNMPLLESMACNKEVIATDYSGHTEFITDNCCKIQITGTQIANDGMWFNRNKFQNCGEWATYNLDDLVNAMRSMYNKWSNGVISGTAKDVKRFTWENTAKDLLSCLQKKK